MQQAITEYVPIDSSVNWDDVDAYLPETALPLARTGDDESRERLHLLHLIGMLLIVAVGSNYALFFDRAPSQQQLDPTTLASMLIANLTTAIGFGTLALSQVPVLHAVGITVGPGAILALLLSALFVPRETAR